MRIAVVTRVKNEPYVETFVRYYLAEGVDDIFLLDDDSDEFTCTEALRRVRRLPQVTVISAREIRTGVTDSWTRWNATGDRVRDTNSLLPIGTHVSPYLWVYSIGPTRAWVLNSLLFPSKTLSRL